MSLTVSTCRCGRRWFRFQRSRDLWDSANTTPWCPGCHHDMAAKTALAEGWREL